MCVELAMLLALKHSVHGVPSVTQLPKVLPKLYTTDDTKFIDSNCNWSSAKHCMGTDNGGLDVTI